MAVRGVGVVVRAVDGALPRRVVVLRRGGAVRREDGRLRPRCGAVPLLATGAGAAGAGSSVGGGISLDGGVVGVASGAFVATASSRRAVSSGATRPPTDVTRLVFPLLLPGCVVDESAASSEELSPSVAPPCATSNAPSNLIR